MRAKIVLSLLLLGLLSPLMPLQGQTESKKAERLKISKLEDRLKSDSIPWAKHKINLTPSSLFSRYHPGVEIGYERLHGKRFSTEYHFMMLTSRDNNYAREARGYMLGFELKYFHINTRKNRWYYGLAMEAMEKTHTAELFYTLPVDNEYAERERADYFTNLVEVDKTFFTVTFRVGMQHYVTPNLILEGYAGIGSRYRNVRHLNSPVTDGFHSDRDYLGLDIEYASNRATIERVVKFDLNVRLVWTF
ncbi:MAG: hypothetical protein Roseis2KO_10150 [Roseivirga sp.]